MSQAIASARNRRAFNTPSTAQGGGPPAPVSTRQGAAVNQQSGETPAGLTLPQVIALVDKRLITLETFMKDTKEQPKDSAVSNDGTSLQSVHDVLDEFNNRFEILAQEIDSLKDIVLKLQSYTMDVNKMLIDERVHVFSELGNNSVHLGGSDMDKETGFSTDNIQAEIIETDTSLSIQTSVDLRDLVKEEFSSSSNI